MHLRMILAPAFLLGLFFLQARALAHEVVNFETDVQPILTRSCGGNGCHINEQTSGVEYTTYQTLMASAGEQYGTLVVIPGDPDASPMIDKVASATPRFGDPMPLEGDRISETEVATLRRWIAEGAVKLHRRQHGDTNGDDGLNITDPVALLNFLFLGGPAPACDPLADADSNHAVNLTDSIFILNFLFLGGPGPAFLSDEEVDACEDRTELSFTSLYDKILSRSCAFSSCHSAESHKGGLSFESRETAYGQLVWAQPMNEVAQASSWLRVAAGQPELSFLLRKLAEPGPGEGNRMPANSSVPLSDATISAFREWILAGAPLEGTIDGVPDITDEPQPPIDRIPQPPVPENGMQLHLPPFSIAPGREREIYYFLEKPFASLDEDVYVQRIDIHMSDESHHFILYQWTGSTNPPAGARNIGGVTDIINQRRFILGAQQSFFSLAFPEGVGLRFSKDESFDLNSHYLNLNGQETLMGEVYINIFFAPAGSITTLVKPVFDINGNINVPPNQTRTTILNFPSLSSSQADPALGSGGRVSRITHIYSLSSHMHRHGTRFKVFVIENGRDLDPPLQVYDNLDWDDPEYIVFNPPLVLQPGQGLRYETTHTYHDPPTPTAPALRFGITSEDEMAIMLGHYATE